MKKKFHYRAIGVLSGDKRDGFRCEICHKEIHSIHHYQFHHPEIYEQVSEMDMIRN